MVSVPVAAMVFSVEEADAMAESLNKIGKSPGTIRCHRAEMLIARAVEGDLSPEEQRRLEGHVLSCASCRETMAELQALEYLLDGISRKPPLSPPFLSQRIISRLPSNMEPGWLASLGFRILQPAAVVAGILFAVALGYLGRDLLLSSRAPGPVSQSVHIIFYSPEAANVALVGDFNEWGRRPVSMAHSQDQGIWEFSLDLSAGVYHYNLLVDGQRWVANPKSSTLVPDGFGGYDSVLVVSEKCQDDCS